MTVGENIFLGKEPVRARESSTGTSSTPTPAPSWRYRLDISPHAVVGRLGMGKQQMAEIAKALSEEARLLILDEPTSALSQEEVGRLMDILLTLKSQGVTCLYISHKLDEFFRLADRRHGDARRPGGGHGADRRPDPGAHGLPDGGPGDEGALPARRTAAPGR